MSYKIRLCAFVAMAVSAACSPWIADAQISRPTDQAASSSAWLSKLPANERRNIEERYAALAKSIDHYDQAIANLKGTIRRSLEALPPQERELFMTRLEQRASARRAPGAKVTPPVQSDQRKFESQFEQAEAWYRGLSEKERAEIDARYTVYAALFADFQTVSNRFKTKITTLLKSASANEMALFAGRIREQSAHEPAASSR